MHSISATPSVLKLHIYIVTILANFSTECNDSCSDEPLSLKVTMLLPYWKDFEKTMHAEFQSFIKNNTWEYKNALSG